MRWRESSRYLGNAFLLILPVLVWHAIFTPYLPAAYQSASRIPWLLATGENVTRWLVILVPILMPLAIKTRAKRSAFSYPGALQPRRRWGPAGPGTWRGAAAVRDWEYEGAPASPSG